MTWLLSTEQIAQAVFESKATPFLPSEAIARAQLRHSLEKLERVGRVKGDTREYERALLSALAELRKELEGKP